MTRNTCGNCEHFAHEPNTPSRGVCWHSAEFDYYAVRGEHWAGCDDWMERVTPEIVMCMDCEWFRNDGICGAFCDNFGRSLHDDYDGFCAWGKRKEES